MAILKLWDQDLFAPDQDALTQFEWLNCRGLGFNIQTYYQSELVSFANVLARTICVNDVEVLAGGLNSVMTPRKHQGKGYGTSTVQEARRVIFEMISADLGLLLCLPKRVAFYEGRGWTSLPCPVWMAQSQGQVMWPYKTMVLMNDVNMSEIRCIDLCGPPF
ncbi:MAG: hypothetical protein ETSY1_30045 [Candidatus Entotheonella factor]|uniref:N-acetyltransferase domain-containing protein n=1 Tax=Entotheonella factor TaxID=1429438 RepID=W4LBU8_ENTF1|nr:MAG: hypothetical protein ETSY1_30045 [Candidatus Entotheonella factor]